MIDPGVLIENLKTIPAVELKLINLACEAVKEDGSLNEEMLAFRHKEVIEAKEEAEGYAEETRTAVRTLIELARDR